MNCEEATKLMDGYLDGELDALTSQKIEQHLRDCRKCEEAYLRAFKSFSGFHGSNGRAWLLTIVRNTAYTLLKKNRAADLTTTFDEDIHAVGHEAVNPATILEHAEDAELIKNAMDALPAEFREILTLRHQESLSYNEIGEILKIPIGTVMSRLARARGKLKEYLAAHIGKDR